MRLFQSVLTLVIWGMSFSWGVAQTNQKTLKTESKLEFFKKADLMDIGIFYYPEQWPKSQWSRDISNMAKLGFNFVHFAESSWIFLEPEEGKFDFQWLEESITLASKVGLKVVLGTPSYAQPAWMSEKYPEILLVGSDGRRKEHGIRANASLTNSIYRGFVRRVVEEMAKRYGNDPRIWGWQIDNEPLATPDYSPSARLAFQEWLKKRYGTIDKLNTVWVGSFWSTRYDNFEQVLIPNEAMNWEDKLSPHALLDFRRFTADVTAEFLNEQADIIKKYKLPGQWVTSNYTNQTDLADPRRSTNLDFPCFTMYPVRGRNVLGGINFRLGNPYLISEAFDFFRPINGMTGIMELQPGQVNWASINPQIYPGTVHMWIMHAMGSGGSFVSTYRFRHPLRSSEMYHDGIMTTDGVTLSQGGSEFIQAIDDVKKLRGYYNPHDKIPEKVAERKTAFLWSHEVMWDLDIQKQTTLWDTWRNRHVYTAAIKSTGAPVDFIAESNDFSMYPFLVAPAYQLINDQLVQKWTKYARNGGHLLLTCRTGQKDANGHFFEAPLAAPIQQLIGADIEFFDMMLPDDTGTVSTLKSSYEWNTWSEILTPHQGTEVLATYTDQFYKGKAAVTTRTLGNGTVTFIGVSTNDGQLEREMVRAVYDRANVEIENLPKGVYIEWRDGFFVGVNYSDTSIKLKLQENSNVVVGESPLRSGNVIIWRE